MYQQVNLYSDYAARADTPYQPSISLRKYYNHPDHWWSDSETALDAESFGVWCEAQGVQRHRVNAKDDKTRLGSINRKCLIFRRIAGNAV